MRSPWLEAPGYNRKAEVEVAQAVQQAAILFHELRPVDVERLGPALEAHRLQQSRDAQGVVGMEVAEEDRGHVHEARAGLHHLPLRALTAVEKQALSSALDHD